MWEGGATRVLDAPNRLKEGKRLTSTASLDDVAGVEVLEVLCKGEARQPTFGRARAISDSPHPDLKNAPRTSNILIILLFLRGSSSLGLGPRGTRRKVSLNPGAWCTGRVSTHFLASRTSGTSSAARLVGEVVESAADMVRLMGVEVEGGKAGRGRRGR